MNILLSNTDLYAIIDDEDYPIVSKHKWQLTPKGYVITHGSVYMHRLITKCPKNLVVDHINHNKRDNRRSNLRIVTHRFNALRRALPRSRTGYFGVVLLPNGKFRAVVTKNKRNIDLGHFNSPEQAARVRDSWVIENVPKEYQKLNFS